MNVASASAADPTGATPTVSIVIVSFRARDHLAACLASIERHAGLDHEVIVVDDGSGDGTPAMVAERFPAVRLVSKARNEGLVAGRNAALPLVRGRLVLMIDADTELRAGALARMAGVLDEVPAVGLVGPRMVAPSGEVQMSCRRWPPFLAPVIRRGPLPRLIGDDPAPHHRHLMRDYDHATARPVVYVIGAAQMWRADLPLRIGLYDRRVSSYGGEDLDWCLRVWEAGLQVRYVPEAEILHHFQQVTRRSLYGRASWRTFVDWYYLQLKHRRLRGDIRLTDARA